MGKAEDLEAFLSVNKGGGYETHVNKLREEIAHLRLELVRETPSKVSSAPQTHLIIGDSHSDPNVPNDRFRWLGKFAADLKPSTIIDLGDFADMGSLSHFDKGKRSFEGRRYWKDIEHAVEARGLVNKGLKKLKVPPRKIFIEGNHEYRITKATDDLPHLDGVLGTGDLQVTELGWEHFPFKVPAVVDGIAYCHYWSGNNGKPIGGVNLAGSILRSGFMSVVQGHSHLFDYSERTRADGRKVLGLSAGCYFNHYMDWAGPSNQMYWRGLVVLHDVVDGYGQVEKVSLEWIEKNYGS